MAPPQIRRSGEVISSYVYGLESKKGSGGQSKGVLWNA